MQFLNNKTDGNCSEYGSGGAAEGLRPKSSSIPDQDELNDLENNQGLVEQPTDEPQGEGSYSVLGDFEIHHRLSQGAMGAVYRGRQIGLDRPVAIKLLPRSIASDKSFVKRFELEAKAIARISSPHVVHVYAAGNHQGQEYFAMEYVEGINLALKLKDEAKLSLKESLDIIKQVALGLVAAAEHEIIHRHIKPSNIMITNRGIVKIMDFGLAKLRGRKEAELTTTGTLLGTANYQSPEQGRGSQCDKRSDIYSLGVVFYQLLTGKLPFNGDSPSSIIYQHNCVDPLKPKTVDSKIPEGIQHIILKCMEKNPDKRYQHPREIVDAIENLANGNIDDSLPMAPPEDSISPKECANRDPQKSETPKSVAKKGELDSKDSLSEEQPPRSRFSTIVIGSSFLLLVCAMYFPLYLNRQAPLSLKETRELLDNRIYSQCREVIELNLRSSPDDQNWLNLKKELNIREARSVLRLAMVQIKRNSFEAAKANVLRGLKLLPKNSQGESLMAQLKKREQALGEAIRLMETDRFLECRNMVEGELENSPLDQGWTKLAKEVDDREGNELLHQVLEDYNQGDFSSAEMKLGRVLLLIPENKKAQDLKKVFDDRKDKFAEARQYLETDEFAKAREELAAGLELNAEDPKWLEFKVELDSTEGEKILARAQSKFSEGDYAHAKVEIAKVLELLPHNDRAKNLLTLLEIRQQTLNHAKETLEAGNFSECRVLIEKQLGLTPTDPDWENLHTELNQKEGEFLIERAKEALKLSDYHLCREISQKILEILPENGEAREIIAQLNQRKQDLTQVIKFFDSNELSRARELIDRHLEIKPNDGDWIRMRDQLLKNEGMASLQSAQVEFKNRNYVLARKLAFQVIQVIPDNNEAQSLIEKMNKREEDLSNARQYLVNGDYGESRTLLGRNILLFPDDQDWLNLGKEINKAEGNSLLLEAIAEYEQKNHLSAETKLLKVTKLLPNNAYSQKLLDQIKADVSSPIPPTSFDFNPLRLTPKGQNMHTDNAEVEILTKKTMDSKDFPGEAIHKETPDASVENGQGGSTENKVTSEKISSSENLTMSISKMKNRIDELEDLLSDKTCTIPELEQSITAFTDHYGEDHKESQRLLFKLEDRRHEELFQQFLEEFDQLVVEKDEEGIANLIRPKEYLESLSTFLDQPKLLFHHTLHSFEKVENRAIAEVSVKFSFQNMTETEIRYRYEAELAGDEWTIIEAEILEGLD